MRKILLGVLTIGLAATVAFGATRAYFFDTETSTGNTFSAGTLDLKVGGQDDPNVVFVTIGPIKPGWSGRYSWILKNVGTIDGQPSLEFSAITNNENGVIEPEIGAAGENGGEPGELGGILRMNIYWRQGSGGWNYISSSTNWGDPILNSVGGKTVGLGLIPGGGRPDIKLPVLGPNDEVEVEIRPFWHVDPGINHNKAQSDSSGFNVVFHLDQI